MNFSRPENALKRADELLDVGKKEDALNTLHAALSHRKFRNLWTTTIEKIATQLIELCVEQKNLKIAREALMQYRTMTQSVNIASLGHVISLFRTASEKKVHDAKQSAQSLGLESVEDLEAIDTPAKVIINSLDTPEARALERSEKNILQCYRFLWESYKAILDILRSNSRMESLYHETAQIALEFCRTHKRVVEFKRLCEILSKNWLDLFKMKLNQTIPLHQTNPHNPDTIEKTLETRCVQLKVATELELLRQSFASCEEIHSLMVKCPPKKRKPQLLAQYYEFLSQICWVSESYLFHAFSCLKTFCLYHTLHKKWTDQERHELASRVVLAHIIVPVDNVGQFTKLTGNDQLAEKSKRMATLFFIPVPPTRQSVNCELRINVLQHALPVAKELYNILEADTIGINLCEVSKPLLDELLAHESKHLQAYVEPLRQVIFFRLLAQLSKVYSNMSLENFRAAISQLVPLEVAEKWIVSSAETFGMSVPVQIDYVQKAILFGDASDPLSQKRPIVQLASALRKDFSNANMMRNKAEYETERDALLSTFEKRFAAERQLIRERKEEIDKRRDEREAVELQKEEEARQKRVKQEQDELEVERARIADGKTKREIERLAQKKKATELERNIRMLEDLSKAGANLVVGGKKIKEIAVADLEKIAPEQIEKARTKQIQKERADQIRKRKMEAKRVDHLARALIGEEVKYMESACEELEANDIAYFAKLLEENCAKAALEHEKQLQIANNFRPFEEFLMTWEKERIEEKEDEMRKFRLALLKKQIVEKKKAKIQRAQLARMDQKNSEKENERMRKERDFNKSGQDRWR